MFWFLMASLNKSLDHVEQNIYMVFNAFVKPEIKTVENSCGFKMFVKTYIKTIEKALVFKWFRGTCFTELLKT